MAYRIKTGCTIYVLEDHKFYFREVKEGENVSVSTVVLDCYEKRFLLHLQMTSNGQTAAECEFMGLHVRQHPKALTLDNGGFQASSFEGAD